jgi:putative heme-binding domain-containing protein
MAIDQPELVQRAALRALGDDSHPAVSALILERWATFLPESRRVALEVMLARDDRAEALLQAAAKSELSVAEIDPVRRDLLRRHRNASLKSLAAEVFGSTGDQSRQAVLAEYQPALRLKGDAAAGGVVFEKSCATCHQIGKRGVAIGPNLASSAAREPAALLAHILDPNQYVLPNYLQYVVVDKQGRSTSGLLSSQSATSVTLTREKGETTTILRGDIEELVSSGKSLMPEGLEKQIPLQSMADLIAFLQQATIAAPGDPHADRDFGTLPGLVEPEMK